MRLSYFNQAFREQNFTAESAALIEGQSDFAKVRETKDKRILCQNFTVCQQFSIINDS